MKIDYDLFERMHKQDGGTPDQEKHYEVGWEACERAKEEQEHCISCKSGRVALYHDDDSQGVVVVWLAKDGSQHSTSFSLEDFIVFIASEFDKGIPLGPLRGI